MTEPDIHALAELLSDPARLARVLEALRERSGGPSADEQLLADELRRGRALESAALVEFMAGRKAADLADVAWKVYGFAEVPAKTMRERCRRINLVAAKLALPLRYDVLGQKVWRDRRSCPRHVPGMSTHG